MNIGEKTDESIDGGRSMKWFLVNQRTTATRLRESRELIATAKGWKAFFGGPARKPVPRPTNPQQLKEYHAAEMRAAEYVHDFEQHAMHHCLECAADYLFGMNVNSVNKKFKRPGLVAVYDEAIAMAEAAGF